MALKRLQGQLSLVEITVKMQSFFNVYVLMDSQCVLVRTVMSL